jgi:hypothetical protein
MSPRSAANENSPPIHRWERRHLNRATSPPSGRLNRKISHPLHGLICPFTCIPSSKLLGYFHSPAFAGCWL